MPVQITTSVSPEHLAGDLAALSTLDWALVWPELSPSFHTADGVWPGNMYGTCTISP